MDHPLTPVGHQHLIQELEQLERVRRPEIAARLKEAISLGDLSENADYETAKHDQALVEGRIQELQDLVGSAEVLHRSTPLDFADVGVRVRVRDLDTDEESEYLLVSPLEARVHEGGLSVISPVGQSLLDCREGDTVHVETRRGEKRLEVLSLEDEAASQD